MEQAWAAIQARIQQLAAANPGRKFKLEGVTYSPSIGQSQIEELPDQPTSSRPQAVEVSVRLAATYAVR